MGLLVHPTGPAYEPPVPSGWVYKPTPYMLAQLNADQLEAIAGFHRNDQFVICQVMEQDRIRKSPHIVKAAERAEKAAAKATPTKPKSPRASWVKQ